MKALAARFGANLRRERHAVAISQEELAFRAGLHRTEIGLLERGLRQPELGTILKLAGGLERSAAGLLEGIVWQPGSDGQRGTFEIEPYEDDPPKPRA